MGAVGDEYCQQAEADEATETGGDARPGSLLCGLVAFDPVSDDVEQEAADKGLKKPDPLGIDERQTGRGERIPGDRRGRDRGEHECRPDRAGGGT